MDDESAAGAPMRVVATARGPIELETLPVRVPLSGNVGEALASLGPNERLYLILQDLRAHEQPGALYHLYLDLPPGAKPAQNDSRYIGTFNFYNAIPIGDGDAPRTFKSPRPFSYDVSKAVRTLRDRGMLSDRPTVTIVAGGTPAPGARPVIGRIELAVQ
ncbi:MAG TPA: hypothetical protein VGG03_21325 [Thermoanaerobaculia bacterium]|jgi:hypothetical protein